MDTCGKRLCFAMGTALLVISLNVVLVMSGVADALYGEPVAVEKTDPAQARDKRLADRAPRGSGDGECSLADRLQQPFSEGMPRLAALVSGPVRSC